ncbi:MAG: corrinoid protein [Candidatus Aminicenantes bacterium]|nr:corrinoid protein [Candidatus Aminicenantes bacterium]
MSAKDDLLALMRSSVIDGDAGRAEQLARDGLAAGLDPLEAIEKGYAAGIQEVGTLWEQGEYFLPELVAGAESMKRAMAVLGPALSASAREAGRLGRAVIGTIEGDIHDIGKNLVGAMLQAHGFEVVDLGADVQVDRFIDRAEAEGADLICASALLTTTLFNQKRLVERLRERNLRSRFKVLVGGAPANHAWAEAIGADGYGENALAAVRAAKKLLGRG